MKSKAQVIREYPELKTLINAVISRVGKENIENINKTGIDGGYSGFIYYSDTHAFAMRYRRDIIAMLENDVDSIGYSNAQELVNSFGVFRDRRNPSNSGMDADDLKDFYKYMGGGRPEQGTLTNVMAWYAAETVCRLFED